MKKIRRDIVLPPSDEGGGSARYIKHIEKQIKFAETEGEKNFEAWYRYLCVQIKQ